MPPHRWLAPQIQQAQDLTLQSKVSDVTTDGRRACLAVSADGGSISFKKGIVMTVITRIIGVSALLAALGAGLGFVLFQQHPGYVFPCLLLGCVGGFIGAVAGTAREIVTALHQRR